MLTSGGYWSTYVRSATGRYASYWYAFLLLPANEERLMSAQVCVSSGGGEYDYTPRGGEYSPLPRIHGILQDTVNKRAVCILLECFKFLVFCNVFNLP